MLHLSFYVSAIKFLTYLVWALGTNFFLVDQDSSLNFLLSVDVYFS